MNCMLKDTLTENQNRIKQFADPKKSKWVFKVGDFICLKLQLYRQMTVEIRRNLKLSPILWAI